MIDTFSCKKPLKNNFYVKANIRDVEILPTKSGVLIYADVDFAKDSNAVQVGTIAACPKVIVDTYYKKFVKDIELKVGDKIYFHHSVVQNNQKHKPERYHIDEETGERLYICPYENIYCVIRNGEIIPLEDFVFCSEVQEKKEQLINPKFFQKEVFEKKEIPILSKKLEQYAIVEVVSKRVSEEIDVKKGDKVFINRDSDYPIRIENKDYFRIMSRNILAVIEKDDNPPK